MRCMECHVLSWLFRAATEVEANWSLSRDVMADAMLSSDAAAEAAAAMDPLELDAACDVCDELALA